MSILVEWRHCNLTDASRTYIRKVTTSPQRSVVNLVVGLGEAVEANPVLKQGQIAILNARCLGIRQFAKVPLCSRPSYFITTFTVLSMESISNLMPGGTGGTLSIIRFENS